MPAIETEGSSKDIKLKMVASPYLITLQKLPALSLSENISNDNVALFLA